MRAPPSSDSPPPIPRHEPAPPRAGSRPRNRRPHMQRRALLVSGLALTAFGAAAQEAFPSKPIQMIVPFPPGGVADITGRPTAHVMGKLLKQSVVVVNKAGAGGSVGAALPARAAPDG